MWVVPVGRKGSRVAAAVAATVVVAEEVAKAAVAVGAEVACPSPKLRGQCHEGARRLL